MPKALFNPYIQSTYPRHVKQTTSYFITYLLSSRLRGNVLIGNYWQLLVVIDRPGTHNPLDPSPVIIVSARALFLCDQQCKFYRGGRIDWALNTEHYITIIAIGRSDPACSHTDPVLSIEKARNTA